jgi:hypothetical protein
VVGADAGSEIWKFRAHALERGPSYLDLHFGISLVGATLYATVALSRIDSSQIVPVIGRGFSV